MKVRRFPIPDKPSEPEDEEAPRRSSRHPADKMDRRHADKMIRRHEDK